MSTKDMSVQRKSAKTYTCSVNEAMDIRSECRVDLGPCNTNTNNSVYWVQVLMKQWKSTSSFNTLTFTILWATSAGDTLVIFFLYFPENRI